MAKQRQHIIATIYDKKGNILAKETNSYIKTHPTQAHYAALAGNPKAIYLHAEIAALVKCKGIPYKIHIERRHKNGVLANAEPCPICKLAIKAAGIKYIEYSI